MSSSSDKKGGKGGKGDSKSNGSGSDGEKGEDTTAGGTGDRRYPQRPRSMSTIAAEAVANGYAAKDLAAEIDKIKPSREGQSAPSTAIATPIVTSAPAATGRSLPSSLSSSSASSSSSSSQHDPMHRITSAMANLTVGGGSSQSDSKRDHRRSRRHRIHRSRSRSRSRSSSPSSDDAYLHGHHSIYFAGQRVRPRDQQHLTLLHRVSAMYPSCRQWYDDNKCSNLRNHHEMSLLVNIFDLACSGDKDDKPILLELVARRINGINAADGTNNWEAADASNLLERRSLMNAHQIRSTNRDIAAARAAVRANNSDNNSRNNANNGNGNRSNRRREWQQRHRQRQQRQQPAGNGGPPVVAAPANGGRNGGN